MNENLADVTVGKQQETTAHTLLCISISCQAQVPHCHIAFQQVRRRSGHKGGCYTKFQRVCVVMFIVPSLSLSLLFSIAA
jgi:hypothetical protein